MNIIESISNKGVKTTDTEVFYTRFKTPKSGDIINFGQFRGKYPFDHQYGRINQIDGDEMQVCCNMGSAFLCDNGNVSISGGPFVRLKISDVSPEYMVRAAEFWNWGDNGPGGGHGVYYTFGRPLFTLINFSDKSYN